MTLRNLAPLALLTAAACAVGPDYEPPERRVATTWPDELEGGLVVAPADLARWWTTFDDPVLTQLVEEAVRRNPGLESAASRVREARYRRAVATGELGPTIDLNGTFDRSERSENEIFSFITGEQDLWSVGFDASWELDVFGRVRRTMQAADAEFEARIEDYRDVLVTLVAEVARNYVELRSVQARVSIARSNERLQSDTLELTESRFAAGLTNELDVTRARSNLASTRAVIPPLLADLTAADSRLAVLLGLDPGTLVEAVEGLAEPAPVPVAPGSVAVGLPAELLRRRPDVRRAERELAAAVARIGVATADLYPRFTLTGSIGLSSQEADDLFESDSLRYAWGPAFSWNVFASGRIANNIRAVEEVQVQSFLAYEETVLRALEEARNAAVAYARQQDRRRELVRAEAAARDAVELARELYTQGVTDFQSVLDAERTMFSLQEQLALTDRAVSTGLITLYKALGGGWQELAPEVEESEFDADRVDG